MSAASVLAAIDAGCDAVDGALDSMSGLTSQPNLSSLAAALAGTERDPGLDQDALHAASTYWEGVRRFYAPFESDIRSGTADVYRHEMPGGQYTNLREQARALGLEHRWTEVSRAYADVNRLFGDIVKVTPTSKVVGDMALMMVANDLSAADVLDPSREIAFPESVVSLFKGDLGFPPNGFPEGISRKVLRDEPPKPFRPGARIAPVDLDAARAEAAQHCDELDDPSLASWLMYPKLTQEWCAHRQRYGDTSQLPTPIFFYGMQPQEEVATDIEPGKTLFIVLQTAQKSADGGVALQYELNGQSRIVHIEDRAVDESGAASSSRKRRTAEPGNPLHVAAPMPGAVVSIAVEAGQKVRAGSTLLALEAMKMETHIAAERDGEVESVLVAPGTRVQAKDLLLTFRAAAS